MLFVGASDFSYNDLNWEMRQIYNNQVDREVQVKLIKYFGADSHYTPGACGEASTGRPGAFVPRVPLKVLTGFA